MKFYGQQQEDVVLYNKYLNYRNGFFIELGAMDGITFSNTKFFEDELEWTGILIEPLVDSFNKLKKNRPNCLNFNVAISEKQGWAEFLGHDAIAGLVDSMSKTFIDQWGIAECKSEVLSVPFYEITRDNPIERVDLFSIDVEGGELGVLKTFDWSIPVYIVLIELDEHNPEKNGECCDLLIKKGFVFDMGIGLNDVWINKRNGR